MWVITVLLILCLLCNHELIRAMGAWINNSTRLFLSTNSPCLSPLNLSIFTGSTRAIYSRNELKSNGKIIIDTNKFPTWRCYEFSARIPSLIRRNSPSFGRSLSKSPSVLYRKSCSNLRTRTRANGIIICLLLNEILYEPRLNSFPKDTPIFQSIIRFLSVASLKRRCTNYFNPINLSQHRYPNQKYIIYTHHKSFATQTAKTFIFSNSYFKINI